MVVKSHFLALDAKVMPRSDPRLGHELILWGTGYSATGVAEVLLGSAGGIAAALSGRQKAWFGGRTRRCQPASTV